jgi:hypothetical protein
MHDFDHDHDHDDESYMYGAPYIPVPFENRDLTEEEAKGMRDNYVTVLSSTASNWFPNGDAALVSEAVFKYIQHHPRLFDPFGDVLFDNIEMANLVLSGQDLGLKAPEVPEELFVGIMPRQVGMISKKGESPPEVMRNTILVGNAAEVSGMVMAAFRTYYELKDAEDEGFQRKDRKTPRERAEERKRLRKQEKRKRK